MSGSEEEVQLCKRSGETAGKEGEATTAAARVKGEKSPGPYTPMIIIAHYHSIAWIIICCFDVAGKIIHTHTHTKFEFGHCDSRFFVTRLSTAILTMKTKL